ncbi:DAPG hydrolase family protein [Pseudooceanicola aestuarii]|uniref:DAPG hydrolase family protein n=1 Tax=Pseudooceanicola aestuarii TaxID=2697319 RepID=UPI0013D49262|nr:hypothetical protein [Pseudooceanicola aestuarii]
MTRPHTGMVPGELDGKPYARHWQPVMTPIPDHARRALEAGAGAPGDTFRPEQAARMLAPGYLPMETGYARMPDGRIFVACLTDMPGVTPEMIDWWFAWHPMEDQRYKLWHPAEHVSCRATRQNGDDAGLSNRQKYLNNPHLVSEHVGAGQVDITITFVDPAELFGTADLNAAGIGTALCARVGLQKAPVEVTRMVHLIRRTEHGVEMRSRFWMGGLAFTHPALQRVLGRLIPRKAIARRAVTETSGQQMLQHCSEEMTHLASFLPGLYADYHPQGTAG